jgi:hypothetical protein
LGIHLDHPGTKVTVFSNELKDAGWISSTTKNKVTVFSIKLEDADVEDGKTSKKAEMMERNGRGGRFSE